jgi:hypothetical protein
MEWWEQKLIDSRRVVKYTAADLEDLCLELKQKLEKLECPEDQRSDKKRLTEPTS